MKVPPIFQSYEQPVVYVESEMTRESTVCKLQSDVGGGFAGLIFQANRIALIPQSSR